MNPFRTIVQPNISQQKINHGDNIVLVGSCFSNNIGKKLEELKFKAASNPLGIVYNPISLFNQLNDAIDKKIYIQDELNLNNELYFHYNFHGQFAHPNPEIVTQKINEASKSMFDLLENARFLFITLGTAWAFRLKKNQQTVANCHKMPNEIFERYLQTHQQIVNAFKAFSEKVFAINPRIKMVFTISPVRHWRDGAVNNQRSKATLTLAMHQMIEQNSNCSYFPSYEIMMDDLRDYRFYADDMIHISDKAVEYIWQRFSETFFTPQTAQLNIQIQKLLLATQHRPFYQTNKAFQSFAENTIKKMKQLMEQNPPVDFSNEIAALNQKLCPK